ncbi:MAG: cytochrome o ubiquinol oxidase subunit IV [Gallionella sp.]
MSHESIDSTGMSRGTGKSYATGFILSIVLTTIPFALVMHNTLSRQATIVAVISAAIVQVMVHLYFFLHLDTSSRARWNVLAMLFAILIMFLIVGGTMWIMYNLNYRMM